MRGPLFMVADGMGGAAAGEIASTMCAEAFAEIDLIRPRGADALRARGQHARTAASTSARQADPERGRDGHHRDRRRWSTRTPRSTFANVGDSRAYLLRDGEPAAALRGPLGRRRAGGRGPDHRGGGRQPSPAQRDHARAGRRAERCRSTRSRSTAQPATSCCCARDGLTGMVPAMSGSPSCWLPTSRPRRSRASWCARRWRAAARTTSPPSCSGWASSTTQPTGVDAH